MRGVKQALPEARFVRLAIGGGTPTFLHSRELEQLFQMLRDELGVDARHIPTSCEASPSTIDSDKLRLLLGNGVDRLSMGIQSFVEAEAAAMGRPQRMADVERALELLQATKFGTCNLDLIYGAENQSVDSFLDSVQRVIDYGAEELFLYPLYVRQLTGLGKRHARLGQDERDDQFQWDRQRLESYQAAREHLLESGYSQLSMRNFAKTSGDVAGPEYCCQTDGMIGLGCGARSYTRQLHYSGEYAVEGSAIKSILGHYLRQAEAEFSQATYGFELNQAEQRRRFLLMSLLQVVGLDRRMYQARFAAMQWTIL